MEMKKLPKSSDIQEILEKIMNKTAKVTVIGLGYVGLPKAALIANAGFHVTGVDIDPKIVDAVSSGRILTNEPKLGEMVTRVTKKGMLKATIDVDSATKDSDIITICVQTPINPNKTPNLSYILGACEKVAHNLKPGKLVMLESTLPPNTTKSLIAPMLEKISGLTCGQHFWLAFSPERVMPGKAIDEFINNPRIIGGFEPQSTKIAAEFLKAFTVGNNLLTDATTAEVAKVAENTFRDVNIAFANQLALICEQVDVDVLEAIKLANTHPRVNIHQPGPGVGGSCLPKDPYLLLHQTAPIEYNVIKTARQMNDYIPHHVASVIFQLLEDAGKKVENTKIVILGTAYKCDVNDSRFSPSETIIKELAKRAQEIVVYDPVCSETFNAKKGNSLDQAVEGSDCIVVLTDHAVFREIDLLGLKKIMNPNPCFFDGKRIFDPKTAKAFGFLYASVGLFSREKKSLSKSLSSSG
jgi:UDP-N-acetyl-D-mannosaminuronic acid dehydrogenase